MLRPCQVQARKKSTKIKFLGPETARWGGGLPREGVVAENFVRALETLSSLGFEERNPGCPGNFAGMSRTPGGVQKVCAKKLRAHISFPTGSPPWKTAFHKVVVAIFVATKIVATPFRLFLRHSWIGWVETYRTLEGGGTRPESCPLKAWTFGPRIGDLL